MRKSKKRRKVLVFATIGVVLVGLVVWSVAGKKEAATAVQVEEVERRDMTEIVVANGRIEPVTQVNISPEVSGEIVELPVVEGQHVKKGDLLLRIKPEQYEASLRSAEADHESALAGLTTAKAELARAEAEYQRNKELFENKLIAESVFVDVETTYNIEVAGVQQAEQRIANAQAGLERAEEDLRKTTIYSPLNGTITRLNSRLGERVHGTAMMAGTDIMTVADLNEMDALVDIGEMDIVLIKPGQKASLEVDAFRDREFTGLVSEIANAAKGAGEGAANANSQEATKFEVKIRFDQPEAFRPGMSVTAEIETQYRTNVVAVPIASVTTRPPLQDESTEDNPAASEDADTGPDKDRRGPKADRERNKAVEVVFVVEGDRVKQTEVEIGISDDDYWEIVTGLEEGVKIVTGGYRAISRDLQHDTKIVEEESVNGEPGRPRD